MKKASAKPVQSRTLIDELIELRANIERQIPAIIDGYAPESSVLLRSRSAQNLLHYLALRRHDLRQLQQQLVEVGVSSLGRCEAHVMATLDQVITILQQGYQSLSTNRNNSAPHNIREGKALLELNTVQLFGPQQMARHTRIMVTLPTEAAHNITLVETLIEAGMNCARINCAHDDQATWRAMIDHVIKVRSRSGRGCTILMDLAGQKIRTQVATVHKSSLKLKHEERDKTPLVVLFNKDVSHCHTFDESYARIDLPDHIHDQLKIGDIFHFRDARDKRRQIEISSCIGMKNWLGMCDKNTLIDCDTIFEWQRSDKAGRVETLERFGVKSFHNPAPELRLFDNDALLLTRHLSHNEEEIAVIGCSHPQIIDQLAHGQSVWFDDGKLGTVVERVDEQGAWLRVCHSRPTGVKLRGEKGINFPDLSLTLPSLTEKDLEDLDFACQYADIIGLSFVQSRHDMEQLMTELEQRSASHLAIIAKIETRSGVQNLPEIILSVLGKQRLGIMIARGDLAVELGGERLAEIQEELMWLCEAAHVPVIWATQVLESLVKKGVTSRAELTDAAMSGRAECVMLNKGAFIVDAVKRLDNILIRMQDHQHKKEARLRALHW
ncbi:MAG: pyruvate kinase [Halothiobacillaceae bacterium]|nr:MAG: pyruvate kinase [Halothiobacillaceae bacterium]